MRRPLRILAVADSDSYVKWGATLLARAPADWQCELVVVATPVLPSANQLASALESAAAIGNADVIELASLALRVSKLQPDVVLISVRGPLVKVIVRTIVRGNASRPVIATGLPGISVPATRMAIAHRAQADVFIVHSRREVDEFSRLARKMRIEQTFSLATLPFLPTQRAEPEPAGDIIFAPQAKVPAEKTTREALVGWLAETARRHPQRRVVIKVRAEEGEQQTHAEAHDYADLLEGLKPTPPANLVVESGPMSSHLARASGLVTVSSTAAIEAIALGVPVLALNDFGVSAALINTVFVDSGLLGSAEDLIDARFHHPATSWLSDNYFHGATSDTWIDDLQLAVARRNTGVFPLKSLRRGVAGGELRKAWDRKRSLGRFDRSLSGALALAIGTPALLALRGTRRLRRAIVSPKGKARFADDEVTDQSR